MEFLILESLLIRSKGKSQTKDRSKILNLMGVKNILSKSSIKIFGNPNLKINQKVIIKDYLKDHRIFMMSMVAALSLGGNWKLHDPDSIRTSFPSFLNLIKKFKKK